MAIVATDWLITSDVALEVAFRIDLPGPDRGRWVLSYLPADRRLSRSQALAGVVLAEQMVLDTEGAADDWDTDVASMYAAELDLSLTEALCLLAVRAFAIGRDPDGDDAAGGEGGSGGNRARGDDGVPGGGGARGGDDDATGPHEDSPCTVGDRR